MPQYSGFKNYGKYPSETHKNTQCHTLLGVLLFRLRTYLLVLSTDAVYVKFSDTIPNFPTIETSVTVHIKQCLLLVVRNNMHCRRYLSPKKEKRTNP